MKTPPGADRRRVPSCRRPSSPSYRALVKNITPPACVSQAVLRGQRPAYCRAMLNELRSFRGGIALAALAGLALRLIYVFGPGRHVSEFGDFHYYHSSANLIAHGHWFVDPEWLRISAKYVPSATHPPLWTLLLGSVSWLGGTSYLAHRAVGCFVGAVAIVLI